MFCGFHRATPAGNDSVFRSFTFNLCLYVSGSSLVKSIWGCFFLCVWMIFIVMKIFSPSLMTLFYLFLPSCSAFLFVPLFPDSFSFSGIIWNWSRFSHASFLWFLFVFFSFLMVEKLYILFLFFECWSGDFYHEYFKMFKVSIFNLQIKTGPWKALTSDLHLPDDRLPTFAEYFGSISVSFSFSLPFSFPFLSFSLLSFSSLPPFFSSFLYQWDIIIVLFSQYLITFSLSLLLVSQTSFFESFSFFLRYILKISL